LLVGAGFGVGMLNKQTILMLAVSLFVGILAGRRLDVLRNRWLPVGVLLAGAIAIPNLVWQASHNWPQFEMAGAIRQENPQFPLSITMVAFLVLTANPVIAPLWIGGLVSLLKSPSTADLRPLGWTAVAAFALLVLAGGQFYYPAPVLIPLVAAGAVAAQRRLRLNEGKRFARTVGIVAASALIGAPIVLPILPLPVLAKTPVGEVNPDALETVGWPELVETVASVYEGLSPEDRARTTLFTSNYGEAGAIERYGPAFGLPLPASGHNNYWLWGPPPDDKDLAIAVGVPESTVSEICADYRLAARIESPHGIDNDQDGRPVWVCPRMRATWKTLWPTLRHYG
ncbi:MAG TPA: glycosyltransferase family 39 protein, partial [Actinomycetota bacterium]|nr:glycosyltransferase family 39 protein [Actinomycetota bacterium]